MITLRAIVDDMRLGGDIGRYSEALTRALIETTPDGCEVVGLVAATDDASLRRLVQALPGIAGIEPLRLPRRAAAVAWAGGADLALVQRAAAARARSGTEGETGLLHAPSLFAPVTRHERAHGGGQTVVTVHDVGAWTNPGALPRAEVLWHRTMARRAARHADAIVVPTHATGEQLARFVNVGARLRVIAPAGDAGLQQPTSPDDAAARAERLRLPERYLATGGALALTRGLGALLTAMASGAAPSGVPLVITGATTDQRAAIEHAATAEGLAPSMVRVFGQLDAADLAVVLARAAVYVAPAIDDGLGLGMLDAMSLGVPVVHADAPAMVELAGGAGFAVKHDPRDYPEHLAMAFAAVLDDPAMAKRMSVAGLDRVKLFSWRDSAEKVWQLHADL